MSCEFNDGLQIDYSGSLQMSKGEGVSVFLDAGDIPTGFKSDLDSATRSKSCILLRTAAHEITAALGYDLAEE
jgi:hypothetical protein